MEYCDQSRPLSQVLKKRNPKRPKKPPKPVKISQSENWVVHREKIISSNYSIMVNDKVPKFLDFS